MKIRTVSVEALETAIVTGLNQLLNEKYKCEIQIITFESRKDDLFGEKVKINLKLESENSEVD